MPTAMKCMLALATLAPFLRQEPAPVTLSEGQRLDVEISSSDPLLEGHGHSRRFSFTSTDRSVVHVWSRSDTIDSFVRVEDASGKLLAEDEDSGGGKAAFVKIDSQRGQRFTIRVASHTSNETGEVQVAVFELPHIRDEDRASFDAAEKGIDACRELWKDHHSDEARAKIAATVKDFFALQSALPDSRPRAEIMDALWNAALAASDAQDLQTARAAFGVVRDERERAFPDEHPELQQAPAEPRGHARTTRRSCWRTGLVARKCSKSTRARCRTITLDLQRARGNLAITIKSIGDLHGARVLEEKVLEILTRTLPDDDRQLQYARINLAITNKSLGNLRGARALEEKVLEVFTRTQPDDHPDLQLARENLAVSLGSLDDLQAARSLFEKVLEVRMRTLSDEHPDLQRVRQDLGVTLFKLGDLEGAQALDEKVLGVLTHALRDDHPTLQIARARTSANLLYKRGDLQGARALQEQVLEIFTRTLPDENPSVQEARGNLGATLYKLGDLEGARELFEKALEVDARIFPDEHPDLQRARLNLAATLAAVGDLQGARALEEKALDVFTRTLSDEHPLLQATRQNLATTIAKIFARAEPAEVDLKKATNECRVSCAQLAGAFTRAVRRDLAHAIADSSGREAEERVSSQAHSLDMALSFAVGCGIFEDNPELEREVYLLSEGTRGAAISAARLTWRAAGDAQYDELRTRTREASDELATIAQRGASPEEIVRSRARLDDAQRELVRMAERLVGTSTSVLEPKLEAFAEHVRVGEALIAFRRYTRHMIERGDVPREHATQSLCAFVLRGDSARPRASSVSDAPSAPSLSRIELGPIEPIEQAVERWRAALGSSAGRGRNASETKAADPSRAGEELRALVLDPLHGALAGIRRVVVALDDVLNTVALDALPAGSPWSLGKKSNDDEPLGSCLRIEVRSSLIESMMESPPARSDELLALGNVAFDRCPTRFDEKTSDDSPCAASVPRAAEAAGPLRGGAWEQGFTELPATRAEVEGIGASFMSSFGARASALVFEGEKASRETMLALASRARWLHIATHGWFVPESIRSTEDRERLDERSSSCLRETSAERVRGMSPMLLCGLALAGANLPAGPTGRVPGLITAEELATLDLSNCELAVLSACDTNVGLRRAGQGVASLQKALHMAGARSVITSLWKVPDEATKDLMLDFYRRLWVEKKPKWQALWEAKTKLREAKDERGALKYTTRDWAAWVLTGEPN